ncbi:MAG: hypothetical protein JWO82_2425 [Akkermansiaceae bacterium]|nr:hypothetical protein [Akkermansiaceae bacterium]
MDSESPYRPPQSVEEQPRVRYDGMPKSAYVFGSLHRIFGYLGILGVVVFIVMLATGFGGIHYNLLNWVTFLLNGVVTGLMTYAGIRLLKKKRNGVMWSNRYAWASIAMTVLQDLAIVLFPASAGAAAGEDGSPLKAVSLSVIALIYPVLALVFLKQPRVKDWVDSLPD